MTDKKIETKEEGSGFGVEKAAHVHSYPPVVDIYETDHDLVMMADIPGVDEHDLQIEMARGVLTLAGSFSLGEGEMSGYYRQFKVSNRVDAEAAEAELKDGVLTLLLPKSEAEKTIRIAVKTLH